ncbi:cobalt-precorrin-6A reductase [Yoonia sp. 208BN28-4]|uniref:cobalt-precorrin-6A reductase n=1 Tax=Yoonia sp. 208BN28-4 TaxID=3126505 RepID=UPI0030986E49
MTLLLLAGSGEAKQIAQALAQDGTPAIASLAGETRRPSELGLPTRVGGFGGADGFRDYIHAAGITAVLDATHPYAADMTTRTARLCAELSIPYCHVLRPPWTPEPGDDWTEIAREEDAKTYIHSWQTVFLGTGRKTLHRFKNLEGTRLICRLIDPPTEPFPFEGGEFLIGRPPFSVDREKELFRLLNVDWLIVKNAGGDASRTKLTAAGDLGIPVLMIKRPAMPDTTRVETVADALAWVRAL